MCTCMKMKNKKDDVYFGRTLDLEFHYNEEAVITPRNYNFSWFNGMSFKTKYAMVGTALVVDEYPLYYEASNEEGLSIAGLNFPYNAKYNNPVDGMLNLTPFEIIPYFLGKYSCINELKKDLENLNITNISFKPGMPLSPLHFMFSDKNESLVVEQTEDGLKVYSNPVEVMTNNPPFDLQLDNLTKYDNLTNGYVESKYPIYKCVGLGSVGLPGDSSSMSRFVKTVFLKKHSTLFEDELESVGQFFHILDNVSMVSGEVLTLKGLKDITFYTSCINTSKGIYYYKTYNNNQISSLRMTNTNKNSDKLTRFSLIDKQNINELN